MVGEAEVGAPHLAVAKLGLQWEPEAEPGWIDPLMRLLVMQVQVCSC